MTFLCDQCGICCRNIAGVPMLMDYDDGTGTCIYLSEDNLCKIYDNRPIWCDVMGLYAEKFSDVMSENEWIAINHQFCEQLKKEHNTK